MPQVLLAHPSIRQLFRLRVILLPLVHLGVEAAVVAVDVVPRVFPALRLLTRPSLVILLLLLLPRPAILLLQARLGVRGAVHVVHQALRVLIPPLRRVILLH